MGQVNKDDKVIDLGEVAHYQTLGLVDSDGQYLSFILDVEEYGVSILSVEEIRCWEEPTLIPNSPPFVKGVINLRGKIVPIIDLREKFSVGELIYEPTTVVIILKSTKDKKTKIMGIVVDAVSEVLNIPDNDISSGLEMGDSCVVQYINGMANVGERIVSLLDVDALFNIDAH